MQLDLNALVSRPGSLRHSCWLRGPLLQFSHLPLSTSVYTALLLGVQPTSHGGLCLYPPSHRSRIAYLAPPLLFGHQPYRGWLITDAPACSSTEAGLQEGHAVAWAHAAETEPKNTFPVMITSWLLLEHLLILRFLHASLSNWTVSSIRAESRLFNAGWHPESA